MDNVQKNEVAASLPPKRNRRRFRSHLVNGDLRLRLVLDDVLFALIAALAAIGLLYYFSNREIGESMYSAHLSIKQTRELLHNGAMIAGAVTFAAVLAFGFWSLVDAHRIAGPMHRLHRLLKEIGDGDLTHEIAFRKRDEFQEIAAATDTLVDVYAERIRSIQSQALELENSLLDDDINQPHLALLRQRASDLTNQLAFFRVPEPEHRPIVDGRSLGA